MFFNVRRGNGQSPAQAVAPPNSTGTSRECPIQTTATASASKVTVEVLPTQGNLSIAADLGLSVVVVGPNVFLDVAAFTK
jgi:hypothetical protein